MRKVYVNYEGGPKTSPDQLKKGRTPFFVFDETKTSRIHKRAKNLARTELARHFSVAERKIVIRRYSLEIEGADKTD